MIKKDVISKISRIMLIICGLLLLASLFIPLWRIELSAPQYPEGLALLIYTNKLGGDVDIINGLNHYIGMATLHAENFIEFSIMRYIIAAYGLFAFTCAWKAQRKWLVAWLVAFFVFGIVAMADFWRWEYNYGHNLDPNAAIIVPGMSYQPPLIGFKQLLNFGAYSIPDIGGWLFILAGLLALFAVVYEVKLKKTSPVSVLLIASGLTMLASCSRVNIEPIALHKDKCEECKMTISDPRFAGELVTKKGRIYKFDDIACMKTYLSKEGEDKMAYTMIADFTNIHSLHPVKESFYIRLQSINSPMQGNIIAFMNKDSASIYAQMHNAKVESWIDIKK